MLKIANSYILWFYSTIFPWPLLSQVSGCSNTAPKSPCAPEFDGPNRSSEAYISQSLHYSESICHQTEPDSIHTVSTPTCFLLSRNSFSKDLHLAGHNHPPSSHICRLRSFEALATAGIRKAKSVEHASSLVFLSPNCTMQKWNITLDAA